MPPKLCYILPEYNPNTEQHFSHLYPFLEGLSAHYQIFLIIERSTSPVNIQGMQAIWVQRYSQTVMRILEMAFLLWKAHWQGCRLFYTHYSTFGGFGAALLTRFCGGRSFYWNCEVNKDHWVSWNPKHWKTKLKIEIPTYLTIFYSHHLVTGTPRMASYYEKTYHLKRASARVLPNWIHPERFQQQNPEGEAYLKQLSLTKDPVLLYVHRVAPRKGAHHLAPLIREIRQSVPNCQFLIVGGGPYLKMLQEEVKQESGVYLTGALPNRFLSSFYRRATIFILPSEQEGFPRVLLEAMLYRLPIVCTDVGGVADILTPKQQEFMVPRGQMSLFANKVIQLLNSSLLRKILAQESAIKIEVYPQYVA
ncbi:MAG: glycosyltransferase family 4 protein, partial [Planctomycetota bacterium]